MYFPIPSAGYLIISVSRGTIDAPPKLLTNHIVPNEEFLHCDGEGLNLSCHQECTYYKAISAQNHNLKLFIILGHNDVKSRGQTRVERTERTGTEQGRQKLNSPPT